VKLNRKLVVLKMWIHNHDNSGIAKKLGVSRMTFWRWLQGEAKVPAESIFKLGEILDEEPRTLLKQKAPGKVYRMKDLEKNSNLRFKRKVKPNE